MSIQDRPAVFPAKVDAESNQSAAEQVEQRAFQPVSRVI